MTSSELSFTPSPSDDNYESEPDNLEPVLKRGHTSNENCSSTHDDSNLDDIMPDPYTDSDSEDDNLGSNSLTDGL